MPSPFDLPPAPLIGHSAPRLVVIVAGGTDGPEEPAGIYYLSTNKQKEQGLRSNLAPKGLILLVDAQGLEPWTR